MKANYLINAIGWIGLITAVVLIGLTKQCGSSSNDHNNYVVEVNVKKFYDSGVKEIIVPHILPGDSIPYPVPADVDTAAILQKYFTKFYYEQTIEDSNLKAIVKDTIYMNQLFSRAFTYQWKKPVSIVTETVMAKKNRFFFGGEVRGNLNGVDFAPGIIYQRKRLACKASYGVLSKRYEAGLYLSPTK